MQGLLIVSGVINILLILACIFMARKLAFLIRCDEAAIKQEREAVRCYELAIINTRAILGALATAAADTIERIRRDINQNHHQLNDGHALDRLVHLIRRDRRCGVICLDEQLKNEVCRLGGVCFVTADGQMPIPAALEFAWLLHSEARTKADLC